jgi:hypothetical protein
VQGPLAPTYPRGFYLWMSSSHRGSIPSSQDCEGHWQQTLNYSLASSACNTVGQWERRGSKSQHHCSSMPYHAQQMGPI